MSGIILTSTMMLKLSLSTLYTSSLSLPKAKSSDNRIPNGKSFIIFNPFSELVYSLVFVKIFILPAGMACMAFQKAQSGKQPRQACPNRLNHLVFLEVKPSCQGPCLCLTSRAVLCLTSSSGQAWYL